MAALKVPFLETSFPRLLLKICQDEPKPLPGHYSAAFRKFIGRMLTKDPKNRPDINKLFEDPFLVDALAEFQSEYEHLRNLRKLSNFKIDNTKLHEDFNNLRTNRLTVYSHDAKKIMEEAQNAVKPSRFGGGNNDVFVSALSGIEGIGHHELIAEGSSRQGQDDGANLESLKESFMVEQSEFGRKIGRTDFDECIKELNDPNLESESESERPETSAQVRDDFAALTATADLKNTLLEDTELDLNYTQSMKAESQRRAVSASNKHSGKVLKNPYNPAFGNSYLKNSVFKANPINPHAHLENTFEIDSLTKTGGNADLNESEIRKQRLNDMFLNKMCQGNSYSPDISQSPRSGQKSGCKSIKVKSKFSARKSSIKKPESKAVTEPLPAVEVKGRRRRVAGASGFLIFSKKDNWERFELTSQPEPEKNRLSGRNSTRFILLATSQTPSKDAAGISKLTSPNIGGNHLPLGSVPLSSVGLNSLPKVKVFQKKNLVEVVDHAKDTRKSKMEEISSKKRAFEELYGVNYSSVYAIVKKMVQFFGIRTVEKNLQDPKKVANMATKLDKNIFSLIASTDRLEDLIACNIEEMKTAFP
jgi:hypothetical protein